MPRGDSGRIVLEIEPGQKRKLYAVLDEAGLTLKDWFLDQVREYLDEMQPSLFRRGDVESQRGEGNMSNTPKRGNA